MPDENKFTKLRDIGYQVNSCCLLCQYGHDFGLFPNKGKLWGRCEHLDTAYEHGKHSGTMELGVLCIGSCSRFEPYPARMHHWAGSYEEFFDDGETNGS